MGLGKTGLSVVDFLLKKYQSDVSLTVIDNRADPPLLTDLKQKFPHIKVFLGDFFPERISQADEIIISPGISLKEQALTHYIQKGKPIIGDIELFAKNVNAPVIAITGTNGKSTVTTLVGEMAKNAGINVKVGGNLGIPALELLSNNAELYVLELSSFQLETTYSLAPLVSTVLNISADHLDRYDSISDYSAAKQRIFKDSQIVVVNRDDPLSFSGLKNCSRVIQFGLSPTTNSNDFGLIKNSKHLYITKGEEMLISADELGIKGKHHLANAMAALALGEAAGFPLPTMLQTLKNFQGLPYRCQWLTRKNDVDWYNDSKGTNISSTLAAIEGLGEIIKGKLILIAGGLGKNQDFNLMRDNVKKYVKTVILMGKDATIIREALNHTVDIIFVKDLKEAVLQAKRLAQSGDAVLLSPACASFDMFKNFEHRGEVFTQLVNEYV